LAPIEALRLRSNYFRPSQERCRQTAVPAAWHSSLNRREELWWNLQC